MSLPGWPHDESPFHAGEQAAQARAGVRARMEEIGRRVLRGAMPLQHREFFALLPFVAVGANDTRGRLQATLLAAAAPGFVTAPDETTLAIGTLPPADDPLAGALQSGSPIGLLGIEFATRRRNRANGVVSGVGEGGFTVDVRQSFGNCPKYIRPRAIVPAATASGADVSPAELLARADTFFIASRFSADAPNAGIDVSHRGGAPGFIEYDADAGTVSWPDYVGNSFFNTIGNLEVDPAAALVVPDFDSGGLLHVEGRAGVVWEGDEVARRPGALRLIRIKVEAMHWRAAALPWRACALD